ncbi:GNAT family N-acetyltransferase [Aquabacter spiritensis]|uniref:Putative N-acetyltransferase YhbS n=1 Tax=Aquabacter spiritensis TaxID=933073 RepID=A0A4R3LR78_9HYPH|nr:N-acetyltransferase [Aquabacter spiritensis]TCT02216.1 putative N-acetyltransferase YhbS [Aquabacter spiritensis]
MTELPIAIAPETQADSDPIEKLHRRTFGPGRFTRTAFRLRERVPHDRTLSFTAHIGTMMVGSVRLTPIAIGTVPALLLGPLTVEPPFRTHGIGARLMRAALAAAQAAGHKLVILVGDAPYYGRFGFQPVPPGRIVMPGPVDPDRLLVAELVPGAFDGVTGAARGAPA